MSDEKSPLVTASTEDIITFLDEVRITLGFSQRQMDTVILLLTKATGANLGFQVGDCHISFDSYPSVYCEDGEEITDGKEISIDVSTRQKNCTTTISYKIPKEYLHLITKKNSFVKST